MLLRLTVFMLLLTSSLASLAVEPLHWKWAEGDEARYLMTQTMNMSIDAGQAGQIETSTRQQMLMNWKVDKVNTDGSTLMSQGVDRIVMKMTGPMGQGFTYDSDSDAPPVGMAVMISPIMDALVESDMQVTMLPSGKLTDIQLSEDLAEAFKRMPGGMISADMVTQMAEKAGLQFPDDQLFEGESWTITALIDTPQVGKMEVKTTYTYLGKKEGEGRVLEAFSPKIAIEFVGGGPASLAMTFAISDSSGELLFDREAGRLVSSRISQVMDIFVTTGNQKVKNTIDQTVEMRELAPDEEPVLEVITEEPETSMAE